MKTEGRVRINPIDWISLLLVIVGAINWGLVGIGELLGANLNLVNLLFGSVPTVEAIVYLLVGLAGVYELYFAYQLYSARRPRSSQRGTPDD